MKNLLRKQEGALGMILVIGFMALAVPLISASLFLSSALSRDSQVKTDILKRQYAALGIGELEKGETACGPRGGWLAAKNEGRQDRQDPPAADRHRAAGAAAPHRVNLQAASETQSTRQSDRVIHLVAA